MKNTITRIIAGVLLACTLGATLCSCALSDDLSEGWGKVKDAFSSLGDEESAPADSSSGVVSITQHSGAEVMSFTTAENTDGYPTATVTATVLPESLPAHLKTVDWSLYWIENKTGVADADVADYVTVSTETDGSTTCTLTCLRPFLGSKIGLKCTTRTGNKSGVCSVVYLGKPDSIVMTADENLTVDMDVIGYGVPCYVGNIGGTYTSAFSLDNALHTVGDYAPQYVISDMRVSGFFEAQYTFSVVGGGEYTITKRCNSSDFADEFFSARIEGDKLIVEMKNHPFLFNKTVSTAETVETWRTTGVDQGTLPVIGAAKLYVTVEDKTSGLIYGYVFAVDMAQEPSSVVVPGSGTIA